MKRMRGTFLWVVAVAVWALAADPLFAEVRLHGLFQDHMVIQRDKPVRVFGWADPGEMVKVSFRGSAGAAQAGADGQWLVELPAAKAGGPFELSIAGRNTIVLKDVLVGDVWVGAGQSNMGLRLGDAALVESNEQIRIFVRFSQGSLDPEEDVKGNWVPATPNEKARQFQAVSYFFAANLQKEIGVPVGIYSAGYGGSHILQWIPMKDIGEVWSGLAKKGSKLTQGQAYAEWAAATFTGEVRKAVMASIAEGPTQFNTTWFESGAKPKPTKPQPGDPKPPKSPASPGGWETRYPTVGYNGVIHPVRLFPVKGFLWYQGEYNAGIFGVGSPQGYARTLGAMVRIYRQLWNEPELPFLVVQLQSGIIPEIRQEQLNAYFAKTISGLVVTCDLPGGIHPSVKANKTIVGARLAKQALALVYGKKLVCSGPIITAAAQEGDSVRIRFEHVGGGLKTADGGELKGFSVRQKGVKAPVEIKAKIDGDTVVAEVGGTKEFTDFCYGFTSAPIGNLQNAEGLPASPFRVTLPFDVKPGTTHSEAK
jgi:sialate O-acetylesterase